MYEGSERMRFDHFFFGLDLPFQNGFFRCCVRIISERMFHSKSAFQKNEKVSCKRFFWFQQRHLDRAVCILFSMVQLWVISKSITIGDRTRMSSHDDCTLWWSNKKLHRVKEWIFYSIIHLAFFAFNCLYTFDLHPAS